MGDFNFLIGVIVGAAIAFGSQQLHWRMTRWQRPWERRNFSRHDERYTPEVGREELPTYLLVQRSDGVTIGLDGKPLGSGEIAERKQKDSAE